MTDPAALIFGGILAVAVFALGASMLPKVERKPVTTSQSQLRWIRAAAISWFVVLGLLATVYIRVKLIDIQAGREANRQPNAECMAKGYATGLCLDPHWKNLIAR